MFRQSLLFMFEFCQELLFNSYNRSDIFAWLPACCNRLFLTLEEIILEYQTAFLGPFSIQGLIPWKSAWTVSHQGQSVLMSRVMILTLLISRVMILLFALLFSGFWTPLSHGHCISIFTSSTFLICNYGVQQNTCPHSILYHLHQEILSRNLQDCIYLCCSFGRYQVGEVSWGEPQPATWDVLSLQKIFSICSSCLWHL